MIETREIIEIDENKCNGCGECILSCAEGAIEIVNGKAKLKSEIYCDGLGECIGICPENALSIIKRKAKSFDEDAVNKMMEKEKVFKGCESLKIETSLSQKSSNESILNNWPIKLKLIKPEASFLEDCDFALVADCVGISFPGLHKELKANKVVAIGCPKLDDSNDYMNKLNKIIKISKPKSISVYCMEVPCCKGFIHAVNEVVKQPNLNMKQKPCYKIISTKGEIIKKGEI